MNINLKGKGAFTIKVFGQTQMEFVSRVNEKLLRLKCTKYKKKRVDKISG